MFVNNWDYILNKELITFPFIEQTKRLYSQSNYHDPSVARPLLSSQFDHISHAINSNKEQTHCASTMTHRLHSHLNRINDQREAGFSRPVLFFIKTQFHNILVISYGRGYLSSRQSLISKSSPGSSTVIKEDNKWSWGLESWFQWCNSWFMTVRAQIIVIEEREREKRRTVNTSIP